MHLSKTTLILCPFPCRPHPQNTPSPRTSTVPTLSKTTYCIHSHFIATDRHFSHFKVHIVIIKTPRSATVLGCITYVDLIAMKTPTGQILGQKVGHGIVSNSKHRKTKRDKTSNVKFTHINHRQQHPGNRTA